MIIKKFQARTEEEAVALAKKEMGENVVVMSSRNIKRKGFLAFLKKPMVEITVGMEEESEKQIAAAVSAIAKTATSPRAAIGSYSSSMNMNNSRDIIADEPVTKSAGSNEKVLEKRLDSLQSLLEQQISKENEEDDFTQTDEDSSVKFLKLIYNTLIDNEVAEKYVNEVMDEIGKISTPKSSVDFLLSNIYQKMILKFGQPKTIPLDGDKRRVIFFIGPTGVGKTTTIAKIASKLCVNHKKR